MKLNQIETISFLYMFTNALLCIMHNNLSLHMSMRRQVGYRRCAPQVKMSSQVRGKDRCACTTTKKIKKTNA